MKTMRTIVMLICWLTVMLFQITRAFGECPLDHFIIGCNADGIAGNEDDDKLFVSCKQKYRHTGSTEYEQWYYPLRESIFSQYRYRIGEPGFDAFQADNPQANYTYDPNRALAGIPDTDYRILVECIAISDSLRAVHKEYPQFTIDAVGQWFNHSEIHHLRGDSHMHFSYQAQDGESLQWITYRLYDALDDGHSYEVSEPFTIVFNNSPLPGDLVIDGFVDYYDLAELSRYWLSDNASRRNDYYERADVNRSGHVDSGDLAILAQHWLDMLE